MSFFFAIHSAIITEHLCPGAGNLEVLPDVSDSDGNEAGARQAIKVKTNSSEAVGTASPLGCGNRCGRSRTAGPIHVQFAIAIAHPIPVAPGNCPERFGGGSRRGPRR